MNYELTIFKNQFDNKTHRHMVLDDWDKFVNVLKNMYKEKGEKGGNNSSPLISPAVSKWILRVVINLLAIGVVGVALMLMITISLVMYESLTNSCTNSLGSTTTLCTTLHQAETTISSLESYFD